jgi:predicted lipoprotein with Yx(FWY)xxD motif
MTKIVVAAIAATVLSFGASAALAQAQMAEPAKIADTSKGKVLVDAKGMTLYILDRDKVAGRSSCNGQCATNWPPFMAPANAHQMGNWSVVIRDDGAAQWAYKGKPLYTWHDDKKPGDVEGDGRANVWHIAVP